MLHAKSDEAISRYLNRAASAIVRARELTQQLLTFSRGGVPVKEVLSIAGALEESVQLALSGSNVTCEFEIAKTLRPVEADAGQLSQVFNNILLNARQAMPNAGVITIKASNLKLGHHQVSKLPEGQYVQISIEDSGTGIPRDLLPNVFDPFYTTKQTGSGLGLATSYSIIKRHCGHISIESELGVGTTLTILLPATEQEIPVATDIPQTGPLGTGRVLLMDDEELILHATGEMIELMGFQVDTAENGEEAVQLYEQAMKTGNKYDLTILDLTVKGGMGGDKAMEKIRELDPEVKAIVSSGYTDSPLLANPKEYGFSGIISKPYRQQKLGEVIRRVFEAEVS